ncbi:MAG: hypothetical protein ABEH81_16225 [Halopenitus sp.]
MPTAIGFRCEDGVVIAADRTLVRNGMVESRDHQRAFGYDDEEWGVAVAGDDAHAAHDELQEKIRGYEADRDWERAPALEALGRMAGEVADDHDAPLVVAGLAEDGVAGIRVAYADGSTIEETVTAVGSGTESALGQLEALDTDKPTPAAAEVAREVIATVAERDPATGEAADVWTLEVRV